jgi:hypothetical protein
MAAALSEDLQRVTHVREAGIGCDAMRPRFHFGTFDLHRKSARATNQMMMVLLRLAGRRRATPPVRGFAVGPYDDVDRAVLGEPTEMPVHGRQAD